MLLPHDDATQFFRLMWGLQYYVKQQRQLLPDVKTCKTYAKLDSRQKSIVRDALWEHPELIDAYILANPDKWSAEELLLVGQWKGNLAGKFHIFRYLKEQAIFIGDSQVYGVKGLFDPFDVIFRGHQLPILVEAVLLPYKGQIIYDGLLRSYGIYFGGGIRGDLKEQYMAAKQNGRIHTALHEEVKEGKAASVARVLTPEIEKLIAEIVQSCGGLQDGTAVQRAAFGVLRASAKVAEAAVLHPDDVTENRRLGRQVLNALRRFEKVLERTGM